MLFPSHAFSPFQEHSYRVILVTATLQLHSEFEISLLAYSPYLETNKRRLMRSFSVCLSLCVCLRIHFPVFQAFVAYEIILSPLIFFCFLYGPCRIKESRRIVLPRTSCVCYEITSPSICVFVCPPSFLGL
jgi:hypothetical protein